VLGVVNEAFPARDRARVVKNLWRFSAATVGLLVAFAVVLALNWSGARLTIHAIRSLVKT
jgi:hypothetical protein